MRLLYVSPLYWGRVHVLYWPRDWSWPRWGRRMTPTYPSYRFRTVQVGPLEVRWYETVSHV